MNEAQEFNPERAEKEALWNKTMQELDMVGDRLGYRIDRGIKETVAAFLVNKFPTYGSCEGHVEERWEKMIKLRPYIGVGVGEPRVRFIGEAEIKDRIAAQFGISVNELADEGEEHDEAWRAYWRYIHDEDVEETPEYLAIRAKNEKLEQQVAEILNEFYKDRQTAPDAKLVIEQIGPAGHFRVTSFKENPEEVTEADLPKLNQELALEQTEVKVFTQFLKDKFFGLK